MFGITFTMKRLMLTALAFAAVLQWVFAGGSCRKEVTILFTNDIRTISRYYADPAQPNIGAVRVLDLIG